MQAEPKASKVGRSSDFHKVRVNNSLSVVSPEPQNTGG